MHRRVVFRSHDHECKVLTRKCLFALHEVMILARRELWLFCPWCNEQLADLVECGPEYTREVHVASLPGFKAVCRGDCVDVNCGMSLRIEEIWHSDQKFYLGYKDIRLCQECVFQIPRLSKLPFSFEESKYYHVQVRGQQ